MARQSTSAWWGFLTFLVLLLAVALVVVMSKA
jgi:hypothetical protein